MNNLVIVEKSLLLGAIAWLGKMVADNAHQNAVAPNHAEQTLARLEQVIAEHNERAKL